MDNLEKIEILENEMREGRDKLARIEVVIEATEQEYLHAEQCSLGWFDKIKRLNELEKERKIAVAKMANVAMLRQRIKTMEDRRIARRKEKMRIGL